MDKTINWTAAEAAVGEDDKKSDWKINPAEHAVKLPAEAGRLQRVLLRPMIRSIMQNYTHFDQEAIKHQNAFKTTRMRLRTFAWLAVAFGLLGLSLGPILQYQSDLQLLFVALHAIFFFAVVGLEATLNREERRAKWLRARARAETFRVKLFDAVAKAREPKLADVELPLAPLKLAYFRRYQLDTQLRYFDGRGEELLEQARLRPRLTTISIVVLIFAALIVFFGAWRLMFEQGAAIAPSPMPERYLDNSTWAFVILAFTTIQALFLTNVEITNNALLGQRYKSVFNALTRIKVKKYGPVQAAAEAEDETKLIKLVETVHTIMIADHIAWLAFHGAGEKELDEYELAALPGYADLEDAKPA